MVKKRLQDKGKKKALPPAWPHDHVVLTGDFFCGDTEVTLPPVRVVAAGAFAVYNEPLREKAKVEAEVAEPEAEAETVPAAAAAAAGGGAAIEPAAAPVEPLDAELEARVMALELEVRNRLSSAHLGLGRTAPGPMPCDNARAHSGRTIHSAVRPSELCVLSVRVLR